MKSNPPPCAEHSKKGGDQRKVFGPVLIGTGLDCVTRWPRSQGLSLVTETIGAGLPREEGRKEEFPGGV